MKIWTQAQVNKLKINNQELKLRMSEMIQILDDNYGAKRSMNDLGGYIMWIDDANEEELKTFLAQYPTLVPEYVQIITSAINYQIAEILFLLSSDYSVVVYCNYELINKYPVIINEIKMD